MTEEPAPRRDRRVALLLWLLPLWLLVSSVAGLWLYFRNKEANEEKQQMRFTTGIAAEGLRDDVAKLLDFVGERHGGDPRGAKGLDRAAAMIEGSLGPSNAGYRVERLAGPSLPTGRWPILIAKLRGKDEDAPGVWVVAGYDSRPGTLGAEANASGVASVLAAAHALAADLPRRSIHFAFVPHVQQTEEPLLGTLAILSGRMEQAGAVLVVESMGADDSLRVSSRDAAHPALGLVGGLGEVVGAEAICLEDDFDLSAALFERGMPAMRVATRPVVKAGESDDRAPDPRLHAAATTALVELIRRLSDS